MHVLESFEHPLLGLVIFSRAATRFRYNLGSTSFRILAAQKLSEENVGLGKRGDRTQNMRDDYEI